MFALTKWIAAPALALGLTLVGDAPNAAAQHGCYGGYGGGYGYGSYSGIAISFGRGHRGYGGGYGYGSYRMPYPGGIYSSRYGGRGGFYHDTTHLDWHPTEVRRHGNHLHVQPGHYDVHHTGHWHH